MVTLNLSHCTASNNAGSVEKGGAYTNTLTANRGFVFARSGPSLGGFDVGGGISGNDETPTDISLYCAISMNGENVTAASFDIATGEIEIDEVTGPLIISTWTDGH